MRKIFFQCLFISILTGIILTALPGCQKSQSNNTEQNMPVYDTTAAQETPPDTTTLKDNFKLTDYDTPPTPIRNPMPTYPEKYRNSGIQGVVVVEVEVSASGNVTNAVVMKSLLPEPGGLDDIAIAYVKQWKFKPALLNNKPVKAKINIPIPFSLKSGN